MSAMNQEEMDRHEASMARPKNATKHVMKALIDRKGCGQMETVTTDILYIAMVSSFLCGAALMEWMLRKRV